jgi:hypothetical protein
LAHSTRKAKQKVFETKKTRSRNTVTQRQEQLSKAASTRWHEHRSGQRSSSAGLVEAAALDIRNTTENQ